MAQVFCRPTTVTHHRPDDRPFITPAGIPGFHGGPPAYSLHQPIDMLANRAGKNAGLIMDMIKNPVDPNS